MAQVFPSSANTLAKASLIVGILAPVLLIAGGSAIARSPYSTRVNEALRQPVPFSHEHHVNELGIDCRYCHTSVEKSSYAGIPPTHTCMSCHSQVWTDAPMLAPVRNSLASGQPLQWERVNQLPDFVFFNHSIHVQKGIGCSSCHGRVDQMPLTWKAHSLYMRWCLDCHEAPERQMRPKSEIFNMKWEAPPDQVTRGSELLKEYHVSKERVNQ